MDIGLPEILIILGIIVVLFVGVKMFGDKRYAKNQNGNNESARNKKV